MSYLNITKRNFIIVFGLVLLFLNFFSIKNVIADEIKERMKQRLPTIVKMKQQGIIGENSRGYLEFVSDNKSNQDIVDSENRDRKEVYVNISKEQGVPIEKVEQLRAAQIVQKAVLGEFLKKGDDTWYKK